MTAETGRARENMLQREMAQQGGFLFRWRGYLPLILAPLVIFAMFQSGALEAALGNVVEAA